MSFFIILFLVGLNGFFVATEFALVSIRRSRVNELINEGRSGAIYVQRATDNLDHYIAGTQVGITLASLALGWVGEPMIAHSIEPFLRLLHISEITLHMISFFIAFMSITVLHVVLGELVPKSIALQQPENVSLAVSWLMSWIIIVFHPLIWTLNGLGNALLKLIGIEPSGKHASIHSAEELSILVNQSYEAGIFAKTERQILQRSFRFGELTAKDIMVRRIDLVCLDLSKQVTEILDEAAESTHSRLPVFLNSLDNIVGFLYIHDLFKAYHKNEIPEDLSKLCRPIHIVPETINLNDLLDFFKKNHTQIAIVIDEYGGTAGSVTFEDVVEEVTGEVEDQLEAELPTIQYLDDGRILLRADVRIDELKTHFGWIFEDEDVDTLAGLIMARLGRIASVDDEVVTPYGIFKVIDMARMRIARVAVLPIATQK